ncbi:MAG: protease modulator HflK, partial [Candidatus Accumulibacter sp. UW25]
LVDSKGSGNLLYLPLDKLMQAAGAVAANAGGSPETAAAARPSAVISNEVPPQVVEKTEARSRENLRQRDRESR